ncbi:MAG: hypothetical protein ABJF50_12010 [Paracoccaceae bacterium]
MILNCQESGDAVSLARAIARLPLKQGKIAQSMDRTNDERFHGGLLLVKLAFKETGQRSNRWQEVQKVMRSRSGKTA